jgi:hypothetical protein
MNHKSLYILLLILLGLFLCYIFNCKSAYNVEPFTQKNAEKEQNKPNNKLRNVGVNDNQYDNYNHFDKTSNKLTLGQTFYGPNNSKVIVVNDKKGNIALKITLPNDNKQVLFASSATDSYVMESYVNYNGPHGTATVYYGPNNSSATIVQSNDGRDAIRVETQQGTYTYTQNGSYYNSQNDNAEVAITSTQYYGSTGDTIHYDNPYISGGAITGPQGNTAYYAEGPAGNAVAGVNNANTNTNATYYDTLPQGIPRSQIPPGQEDLYILKSQIVPPVCPACPPSTIVPREEKCPPCPPCARCPESSFECKKVPNYSSLDSNTLPVPVLADFSTFGM